jgi:FtsZ-binding cell division protein ZapB
VDLVPLDLKIKEIKMSKVKLNLTEQEAQDIIEILEREVKNYSQQHAPERIVRLRQAIEELKS